MRCRKAPPLLFVASCAVSLLAAAPALAQQREVWVVNEQSLDISIIDSPGDVPSTIETISLGTGTDPAPYGIAFSTFATDPGSHAFVTQGPFVKVIDVATRGIVSTVNLATLLGRPDVIARGADSARPDRFIDAGGSETVRYYLHIAADVRPAAGMSLEPWFIVLNQEALAGLTTAPALVDDGRLTLTGATGNHEAMEVRVLGAPAGDAVQRAWYSYRVNGSPPSLGAARVISGGAVTDPWTVDARRLTTGLATVPDSIHPGAPHSRELPLLPEGSAGTVRHLDSEDRCTFDGMPRAVSVTGPGLASFDVWTAIVDPLGPDTVELGNWETCEAFASVVVGENPVDMDTLGRVEWQELYVASRETDSVSIIDESDPTTANVIQLTPTPTPPCVKCPRSIAVVESPGTVCRAVNLDATPVDPVDDVFYTWDGLGCQEQTSFKVWCRCLSPSLDACPVDCVANCPPSLGRQTGEVWCEVDVVESEGGDDGGSKTVGSGGGPTEKTQVNTESNDRDDP
jgi:hypothetical protein